MFELLTGLATLALPVTLRLLVGSCRVTTLNPQPLHEARGGTSYIAALWHQHILFYADFFRRSRFVVLVSRSRDGELGARVIRAMGLLVARGSSSAGGREALTEMISLVHQGRTVAFIADGPRGPAREAKPGVVYAAKQTGRPIIPVGVAMTKARHTRSWDRMAIPMPGSHIVVKFGEPIRVPADASREQCESIREQVQDSINRLEAEASERLREKRRA